MISVLPDNTIYFLEGLYHGVYEMQIFMREGGVNKKE